MVGMRRRTCIWVATIFALAGVIASPSLAETPASERRFNDARPPLRVFDRPVNLLLVPQLREPDHRRPSRRPPKPTTILQLDSVVDDDSDLMLRVQAKKKKLIFFEYRF